MKGKKKEKQLHPYQISVFSKIPLGIRLKALKWWCFAATYYFVGFGMPMLMHSVIDTMFTLGLVLGLVYTFIINTIVNGLSDTEEIYNRHIAITSKSPLRIIYNVLYSWAIIIMVAMSYQVINMAINAMMGYESSVIKFGVEPIFFGIIVTFYDMVFIAFFKRLKDAKNKKSTRN